jgi:hypothetical protein
MQTKKRSSKHIENALKHQDNPQYRISGKYWLRVVVAENGDILLDNAIISNRTYLNNYLFTDDELALFHQTTRNEL